MDGERKSALVTVALGILCAGVGIGIAAATNGGYIAVGGIILGLIMVVGGAWKFSRAGFIVLGVLLAVGVALIMKVRRANEDHGQQARKTVAAADGAALAQILETSDSGTMRYAAAREIRRAPGGRSVEALVKALDADVTTGWYAQGEVERFWLETLNEGPAPRDPSIRGQAIESLEELGDPRALPGLIALMGDPQARYHHGSALSAVEEIAEQNLDRDAEWAAWWAAADGRWRPTRLNRDKAKFVAEGHAPLRFWTVTGIVAFRDDDSGGTSLIIGCDLVNRKAERVVAIDWGANAYIGLEPSVRYQIGDGPLRTETWKGKSYMSIRHDARPLIEELVASSGAAFRAETPLDKPLTLTVSTEGLDKAIAKVECKPL